MQSNLDMINQQVRAAADRTVRSIAEDTAKRFRAYIEYEFMMSNIELAAAWKGRGYSFSVLPEDLISGIEIMPTEKMDSRYRIDIKIPSKIVEKHPKEMIDYFLDYSVANAMTKLKTTTRSDAV